MRTHAVKRDLIVTLFQLYFLANIVQTCIQRGGIMASASPVYAQDVLEAAISRGAEDASPAGHMHFKVLAGEIEKLSNSWGQLLLRLQQKNSGDAIDTLSESVLAVQLMQSRLAKLSGLAAADGAKVTVSVASACSRMMKVGW
jgi:hypothetical protein